MASYAISYIDSTPAKRSLDGKRHQHKYWFCGMRDLGLGEWPLYGRRKDRMIFARKNDAKAFMKMYKVHGTIEKID